MKGTSVRILVPASERKQGGGTRIYCWREAQEERSFNRFPSLTRPRRRAVAAFLLAQNGEGRAAEVLRMAGETLRQVSALNKAFYKSALLPVLERESGPLFKALDAQSLDRAAHKRLRDELVVVCPLLGLLAPTDLVPHYRCPVGAQTRNEIRSLHEFWKPHVSQGLDRLCRRRRVFSFLTARLRALWRRRPSCPSEVQVVFGVRKEGPRPFVQEHAGAGRFAGELVRHLLSTGCTDPEELRGYQSSAGHAFSDQHSRLSPQDSTLVFLRT